MKMNKNITRRYALGALVAAISFFPSSILAFSKSDAEGLIKNLTVDVLRAVNEQISEEMMFSKFEMIFSSRCFFQKTNKQIQLYYLSTCFRAFSGRK